jgi:hypothetical protein
MFVMTSATSGAPTFLTLIGLTRLSHGTDLTTRHVKLHTTESTQIYNLGGSPPGSLATTLELH